MNHRVTKSGAPEKFTTRVIKAHKAWRGTIKPQQERVLRLLRAEFIDILKRITEGHNATIQQKDSSIELTHENQQKGFAYFDIYRDDNKDRLIHLTRFALKYIIEALLKEEEEIKRKFAQYIPAHELDYCNGKLSLNINVKQPDVL